MERGLTSRFETAPWSAGYFLALATAFFLPSILTGRVFYPADFLFRTPPWYDPNVPLHNFDLFDVIVIFFPHDRFLNHSLHQGSLPLWDPFSFCGHPIMADGFCGWLYPPRLLAHWLLPVTAAHTLLLYLHLFLAGFGMWMLARRLGQSAGAALLSGTAWMFNGVAMSWFEFEHFLIMSALLPLLLIAVDRTHREWKAVPLVSVLTALLTVSGILQGVLNVLLIAACFAVYRNPRACLRSLLGIAAGLLLAAPLLLLVQDLVSISQRPVLNVDFLMDTFRSFLVTFPPTILWPDAWGTPVEGFSVVRIPNAGNFIYPELCGYMGVLPFLLALVGARQRGVPRFLTGLALASLILPATPLYRLLYLVPGIDRIIATRLIYVWVFAVALLAGFGWDALKPSDQRRLPGLALLAAGALALTVSIVHASAAPIVQGLIARHSIRLPVRELFLSDLGWADGVRHGFDACYSWSSASVWMPLVWLVASAFVLWRPRLRLALMLAALDLMLFALRFNTAVPTALLYPENQTTGFLHTHAGHDRVLGVGTFKPNTLMPLDVYDPAGYTSIYPRRAALYMGWLMYGPSIMTRQDHLPAQLFPIPTLRSPLIDLASVRYQVAYPGQTVPDAKLVAETPLRIFENPHAMPRAFVVFEHQVTPDPLPRLQDIDPTRTVLLETDPQVPDLSGTGTAALTSYSPDHVETQVTVSAPAWLVLTDTYTKDWHALVDGQSTPVLPADGLFRSVRVPAGTHRVVFDYDPPGWRRGWLISLGTALALLVLWSRS